jgi:hypothetical protein
VTTFDPSDHQKLRDAFSDGGIVGPGLLGIHMREEEREAVLCDSFRGYRLLHQCFLAFLHDSLQLANSIAPEARPPYDWYRPLLVFLGTTFSRARAAEILYLHGYALEGFALLRDLKDRAVLLAGVLHGATTIPLVLGFEPDGSLGESGDYWAANRQMTKRRRSVHREVFAFMLTRDLPGEVAGHLRRWADLFHYEVHMSLHSLVHEGLAPYRSSGQLRLGPNESQLAIEMYMNRSLEVCWALLRVLPIVQKAPKSHGPQWCAKWELLDRNLGAAVSSVPELATDIGPSLLRWFDLKLPFNPSSSFLGRPEPAA